MTFTIKPVPVMASLMAMANTAAADEITFVTFAGYYPPQLLEEFEKETGTKVNFVEIASNEELMGRMIASRGTGFDVMIVSSPFVTALNNLEMLAELNHENIPNLEHLYSEVSDLAYDPGMKMSVPYAWGTFGLCYRTDLVTPAPTSWRDLLEPSEAVSGRYTMVPDERWFIEPAQLAVGKSINDVSQETLEEIRPLLESAKRNVMTFDNYTLGSRLLSGEAVMATTWDAYCDGAIAEGTGNIAYLIPEEGGDTWVDVFVVPAMAENKDAAEAFINFVLQPDVHQWVTTELLYKVPNEAAMSQIDPDFIAQYPGLSISAEEMADNEILADLGPDAPRVSRFVTEVMATQ